MRQLLALFFLAVTACGAPPIKVLPAPPEEPPPPTQQEIYQRMLDSTVQVFTACPDGTAGSGSGVVVRTRNGKMLVATAAHVTESEACLSKVDDFSCTLETQDEVADVALLSCINHKNREAVSLSTRHWLGMPVVAVGYPNQPLLGRTGLQLTTGVLSAFLLEEGRFKVSSPIYFGNSGGPLFSADGALHGLVVSCMTFGGFRVPMPGEYYVTPVENILALLEQLDETVY